MISSETIQWSQRSPEEAALLLKSSQHLAREGRALSALSRGPRINALERTPQRRRAESRCRCGSETRRDVEPEKGCKKRDRQRLTIRLICGLPLAERYFLGYLRSSPGTTSGTTFPKKALFFQDLAAQSCDVHEIEIARHSAAAPSVLQLFRGHHTNSRGAYAETQPTLLGKSRSQRCSTSSNASTTTAMPHTTVMPRTRTTRRDKLSIRLIA